MGNTHQSSYKYVNSELYDFVADPCRRFAFCGYICRWPYPGSNCQGTVRCTLENGETIGKDIYNSDLSGKPVHCHGYFRYDIRNSYCTCDYYRKSLSLFAPIIGCLGTFITGSDTSSNILFGKLQASVAGHIQVSPDWLSAANTVGATGGKIISPQSIAIATSAGNQQGKEGEILKAAIPYALVYVCITGIIVYLFS